MTAVPARVVEGAASTVTVSVDKEFEVDQTITLAVGGTAASGDYSLSSSSLTAGDAGDMSVTATVTAVDDSVIEGGDETVVVTASATAAARSARRRSPSKTTVSRHGGVVGDGGAREGR